MFYIAALLLCASSAPAMSAALLPGTNNVMFDAFDTATQGTLLASKQVSGTALTFAGIARVAVYRNTLNTIDFYYQFTRTGAGLSNDDAVETLTGGSFTGYMVNALFSDADVDGAGIFTASNNPGAPATAQRNLNGGVVGVDFAPTNPVGGQETSATYIFRTDAVNYNIGTFGVIDGSTFSGPGFAPAPAAVPEPATWAIFVMGFGGIGFALRSQKRRAMMSDLGSNLA